jgi:hypothetical protein
MLGAKRSQRRNKKMERRLLLSILQIFIHDMPQPLCHKVTTHNGGIGVNKRMPQPKATLSASSIMTHLPNDQEILHRKIVEKLSPSSGLFEDLWPVIIDQAPFGLRTKTLSRVCRLFNELTTRSPRWHSDLAKLVSFISFPLPHTYQRDVAIHKVLREPEGQARPSVRLEYPN